MTQYTVDCRICIQVGIFIFTLGYLKQWFIPAQASQYGWLFVVHLVQIYVFAAREHSAELHKYNSTINMV